mgnify:FL=1
MDKKILLTIKGNHISADGEQHSIEFVTEGRLFQKDGVHYIEYEESAISSKEGTKTLIAIDNNSVSMERTGTSFSHLFFEPGKSYVNNLMTPYGILQMGIIPTRIKYEYNEEQGRLDLVYQMAIDGKTAGTNELTFFYK